MSNSKKYRAAHIARARGGSGPPGNGPDPPEGGGAEPLDPGMEEAAPPPPSREKGRGRAKPSRNARALGRFLVKLALAGAAGWLLLTYVGGVFICHSSDMYPALRDGDLVITYRLGAFHSGDVVACRVEGQTRFGRIVGEPGDEIYLDAAGEFTVNGIPPYETVFYATFARESDSMTYPYVIRPGEYFLLTDARETGLDSRNYGPVTDLMGKVVLAVRRRGF